SSRFGIARPAHSSLKGWSAIGGRSRVAVHRLTGSPRPSDPKDWLTNRPRLVARRYLAGVAIAIAHTLNRNLSPNPSTLRVNRFTTPMLSFLPGPRGARALALSPALLAAGP